MKLFTVFVLLLLLLLPILAYSDNIKGSFQNRIDKQEFPSWYRKEIINKKWNKSLDVISPTATLGYDLNINDPYFIWNSDLRLPHDRTANYYFRNISQHFFKFNLNPALTYDPAGNYLPQFDEPAGIADIDIINAWSVQSHASNVIVAIIDSGIDGGHPDLIQNIIDITDTNSLTDSDFYGHGTMVAGVIGAIANNAGVVGVCRNVKLWPIKSDLSENQVSQQISNVVDYSILSGCHVIINMSFGYTITSGNEPLKVKEAIQYGELNNVLFCVAAINATDGIGNQDEKNDFPASWHLSNVIVVGGHTRDDMLYSYVGTNVHLMAGARLVATTARRRTVNVFNVQTNFSYLLTNVYTGGTSFATPQVSGTAALCWQKYPNETYLQVKERLLNGVITNAIYDGKCQSGGRLNSYRSLIYSMNNYLFINRTGIFITGRKETISNIDQTTDLVNWYHYTTVTNTGYPQLIATFDGSYRFFRINND